MGLLALYQCILEVIFFLILLRVTTKIALILLETLNLSLQTMLELLRILEPLERDKKHFVLWDGNEPLGQGESYGLSMKYAL